MKPAHDWGEQYDKWKKKGADDRWDAHWISPEVEQRTLKEATDDHIRKVITQCHGQMTMAALVLGVCRASAISYARELGINVDSLRKRRKIKLCEKQIEDLKKCGAVSDK